ncbi:hypothetical protein [Phenylobacterium sp.]|uniref:hypothetical protein n=1 Tax=Phenylobacterium sp. TaxID=1871053 RepID=UPI003BABEC0F
MLGEPGEGQFHHGVQGPRQFEAFAWFEETGAVTPLAGAPPEGAPDIYPFGL